MHIDAHEFECSQPTPFEQELATMASEAMAARRATPVNPWCSAEGLGNSFMGLTGQLVIARYLGDEAYETTNNDIEKIIAGPPKGDMLILDCHQNGHPISIKVSAESYLLTSTKVDDVIYVLGKRMPGVLRFNPVGWCYGRDLRELTPEEKKRMNVTVSYGLDRFELRSMPDLHNVLQKPRT